MTMVLLGFETDCVGVNGAIVRLDLSLRLDDTSCEMNKNFSGMSRQTKSWNGEEDLVVIESLF
jgi:hypothetical protein